jgi:intracellular septation protein
MRLFLTAAKPLLLDLASTLVFLGVFLLTGKVQLAVALGMLLGAAQIVLAYARQHPPGALQWLSLFAVLSSGAATLITHDPRFVMIKPSLIYLVAGIVMLKPGWMLRYLPPAGQQLVPDIATIFGYIWAGLMFTSAILNIYIAWNFSLREWAHIMPVFAFITKASLFVMSFAIMRSIGKRRSTQMPLNFRADAA